MADIIKTFTEAVMEEFPNPAAYIDDLATIAETNWKKLASEKLHSTKKVYVQAIVKHPVVLVGDKISVTVELTADESPGSWLPNMLEQGHAPYDMKTSLTNDKDHQVIFMRKGTPEATNLQRMSSQQYSIMKNLKADKPLSSGGTYGVHYTRSTERRVNRASGRPYQHKEDIYQRMHKIKTESGSTMFGTFRTVSKNSAKASWYHPGLAALNLAEQVIADMGL